MKLESAIRGDLEKFMKDQQKAAEVAVTAAVTEITNNIKQDLRTQVASAGLGQKLARTWQSKLYPKGQKSIEAAGWIFSKAPELIRAFNDGVVIKSKEGFFLAIPTPAAPKRGVGGKRISPSTFPEHVYGRLRFVYRPNNISLLVVDNLRAGTGKRGGFRKASESAQKSGRGLTTVVMFFLVPQVMLRTRLNYQQVVDRWLPQLPSKVIQYWPQVDSNEQQT